MAFHVRPGRDGDVLEECVERGELASGERQSPVRDSGLPGHSTLWGPMWRGMAQYRPAKKGFDHSHGNMIEARLSVWYYRFGYFYPPKPPLNIDPTDRCRKECPEKGQAHSYMAITDRESGSVCYWYCFDCSRDYEPY
jgi:hypothetical protein